MQNEFRLKANAMFERPEELNQELPSRIVFLSVEGNKTEQSYFDGVEKYREQLGIKAKVHVHSLRRAKNDNLSAPTQVLELLEEYIEIRESQLLPERMRAVIPKKYTDDFIVQYVNNPESIKSSMRKEFEELLQQVGIDLEYDYFLKEYRGEYDRFGVVIDRDHTTHSVMQLNQILNTCQEKGYQFFISNPCIEFWLLMHLVNICDEYDDMQKFKDNAVFSRKHTYTSNQVSERAGHAKKISDEIFEKFYLPKVDFAIRQARETFTTNIGELIGTDESEETKKGKLGSNLPELFVMLREI